MPPQQKIAYRKRKWEPLFSFSSEDPPSPKKNLVIKYDDHNNYIYPIRSSNQNIYVITIPSNFGFCFNFKICTDKQAKRAHKLVLAVLKCIFEERKNDVSLCQTNGRFSIIKSESQRQFLGKLSIILQKIP